MVGFGRTQGLEDQKWGKQDNTKPHEKLSCSKRRDGKRESGGCDKFVESGGCLRHQARRIERAGNEPTQELNKEINKLIQTKGSKREAGVCA